MHKSRLAGIVIDCQTGDLDEHAEFWGAALGRGIRRRYEPGDENYRLLEDAEDSLQVLTQKVEHPSRIHLDIETNDIEAEVQRLEGLGAQRLNKIRDWWVMQAPSGQRFCVVKPQRSDFEELANVWEKSNE